jgi:hypothetical protein
VANLESDIIGRVNRLALRPSEKNALMPLMEAVSNSVHSITDLYGTDSAKGQIIVRLIRQDDQPAGRVVGFDVEDMVSVSQTITSNRSERRIPAGRKLGEARASVVLDGSKCLTGSRLTAHLRGKMDGSAVPSILDWLRMTRLSNIPPRA